MNLLFKNILVVTTAVVATASLIGCQETEYPAAVPATGASTLSSRVMFVNAAPGTSSLSFFMNNVAAGTAAFTANTPYASAPVGSLQFRAKATAGTIGGTLGANDVLYRVGNTNQNNFVALPNTSYSVFVVDTTGRVRPTTPIGVTDPGGLRMMLSTDVLTAPAAGNAAVRFYHLSPNAPNVWVRVVPAATNTAGRLTTFDNRAYTGPRAAGSLLVSAANAAFTALPAGAYSIQVRTTNATTGATAIPAVNVTLEAGKIYTVYARGLLRAAAPNDLGAAIILHN